MPDVLNEHGSESSTTLDPTLDESARVDPFQKAKADAIDDAAWDWLARCAGITRKPGTALHQDVRSHLPLAAFRAGVEAAAEISSAMIGAELATVPISARVDPFQEERDCAIIRAAVDWIREHGGIESSAGDMVFDAFVAGIEAAASLPRVHRIGVFDYDSLVECLKLNFERAFPGETMRDPQDAIQRLAAQVMIKTAHDVMADAYRENPNYTSSSGQTQTRSKTEPGCLASEAFLLRAVDCYTEVLKHADEIVEALRLFNGHLVRETQRQSGTDSSTTTTRARSNQD